jgi:prephenate dehydrogenase/cyclohexadieny/prephenate dehydrogenase
MFRNILIIGFGMIGSSIALSAKKSNKALKIYAFDKSPTIKQRLVNAKLSKVTILKSLLDINQIDIDLIIICTPVLQYLSIFKKINNLNNHKFIVTDVGSTKYKIENLYTKNNFKFRFVPAHPIAGIEKSGLEYGFDGLFKNRYNIICPIKNTPKSEINKIVKFWKSLFMKIEIMTSKEHDHVLSLTSHLPHVISYSLVLTAMKKEKSLNSKLIKFSAGGFRDFTRVAGSDPEMWRDIFLTNSDQIQKLTNTFIAELKKFSKDLNSKNSKNLLKKLELTKKVRNRIVKARQAGKFIPND